MMKRCVCCNRVGLWFQFYTNFRGIYTWTPDLCKRCADWIAYPAIVQFMNKNAEASPCGSTR